MADQIRLKVPKLATIMDAALQDVRVYMSFPKEHRSTLHSTNPIERLNGEIKRRTDAVGIFSNDDAIIRLVGALLLEQNDEWAVQRCRYVTLETMVPGIDKAGRTVGTWTRAHVPWDPESDRYFCPEGQELKQFRRHRAKPGGNWPSCFQHRSMWVQPDQNGARAHIRR